jgi:PHD/YefM family antitoxin component YafN of YafNO toxin-antitoxin module
MNIEDVGSKFSQLVQSLRSSKEACEVTDEAGQTVAVVLPVERYESYQTYQRQREKDFAVLDKIDEDLKDYDPGFIESQIEKAVDEVKAEAKQQTG